MDVNQANAVPNTEIKQSFRRAPPRPNANVQFSDHGGNPKFTRSGTLPPIPVSASNSFRSESNYYDPIRHIEAADCSRQNSVTDGSIQVKTYTYLKKFL